MAFNLRHKITGICQRLKKSRLFSRHHEPKIAVTLLRWLTLLIYSWLGAVAVHLLWPWLAYLRPERLFSLADKPGLYALLQVSWSLMAALLVLMLQDKFFIRFPRKQHQSGGYMDVAGFIRYPTLHISVLAGIFIVLEFPDTTPVPDSRSLLVFSAEVLSFPVSVAEKDTSIFPILAGDGLAIFFVFYAFILAVRTENKIRQSAAEASHIRSPETLDLLTCSDPEFEAWIQQERDEKTLDFFDRSPYIGRMLARITQATDKEGQKEEKNKQRSKGQILLGEFGSGKTTIVNLLEKELDPEWIVSRFDCWQRAGKPQELAAQLMEQIIYDVGQQFEAASLAGLPESFASALYGSNNWWQLLDIWLRPDTPEQVIERLDTLLKVNNRKLLLVVENIDRNEEHERFINIIAAILDKFQQSKGIENIHFIFSADEARLNKEIVYRIADHRERLVTFILPDLLIRFMALCLDHALKGQKNGESLIIPYLSRDFLLPVDVQGKMTAIQDAFALRSGKDGDSYNISIEYQVLVALVNILSNPRRLKHVLRDVYQLWIMELAGEVNLLDLLLYATANEEGSIKESMEQLTLRVLDGSDDNPFTAGIRRKWHKNDEKTLSEIPVYDDSDVIAFYLLNVFISPGQPGRTLLSQPLIDHGGHSEKSFEKYRKLVDTGAVKGYGSSDQEFLRNYIKASSERGDQQALKACLNFALSSSHNLEIFENLLDTMTKKYFSSVTELYQFAYHAIALADSSYSGTMSGVLRPLIKLCFDVMNFDGHGGENHVANLQEKLTEALKNLADNKQYSYLLRASTFLVWGGSSDLCSRVINTVAKTVFTCELSEQMAKAFRENEAGTGELQYEYILLLPALEKAKDIIGEETLGEVCHSFLIVSGMKLKNDPQILVGFAQRYPEKLKMIKDIIAYWLEVKVLTGVELNAWQELQRLFPEKTDKEPETPAGLSGSESS